MSLNGLLLLVASKPMEELSKEDLNIFLKRFCTQCEEERSHTVSLRKFINEIHLKIAIDRFARCRSTNRFPSSLTPLLLRQIKQ